MPEVYFKVKYPELFWHTQNHCIPLVPVIPQYGGINTDNTCRSLDAYNRWNRDIRDQIRESIALVENY